MTPEPHPLKTKKEPKTEKLETNHPLHVINRIEVLREIYHTWSNSVLTQLKNERGSIAMFYAIGRIMKD